jgi:tetratricopeptide (TPR) repeat protein
MENFSKSADQPSTALHGLQTLMTYNEERWFMDVENEYGRRFYNHMQIQFVIAQGLCRFGHYAEAELYCRKALVLGGGPPVEELLELCQKLRDSNNSSRDEALRTESALRPFTFPITVAASLLAALIFTGVSATRHHTAWLVSGAPFPYAVMIDQHPYEIEPFEETPIRLRPGQHTMSIVTPQAATNTIAFEYSAALLKQKREKHALILNPDGMALLTSESVRIDESEVQHHAGRFVYPLAGIDYPFRPFPVRAGFHKKKKTRLFLKEESDHKQMISRIQSDVGNKAAVAYARQALIFDPDSMYTADLLKVVANELSTDEMITFLLGGRNDESPRIYWHLAYQDYVAGHHPSHELQTEYAKLCNAHPDEPLYFYLLGQVISTRSDATMLFEKSEKGRGCRGVGYQAIARDLLCSGKYAEALPYSEKALEANPANPAFNVLNMRIHLALRHYDRLVQSTARDLERAPENAGLMALHIKYLTLLGDHKKAAEAENRFPADRAECAADFHAARFYAVGNTSDYLESLTTNANTELQRLLHADRTVAVHEQLGRNEEHEYFAHLVMYSAAHRSEQTDIASIELEKALLEVRPEDAAHQQVLAMLTADTPPTARQLLDLRIWPKEKTILSTALGFRFPEQQQSFFKIARHFNHTPEYPQLLIRKWTLQTAAR